MSKRVQWKFSQQIAIDATKNSFVIESEHDFIFKKEIICVYIYKNIHFERNKEKKWKR